MAEKLNDAGDVGTLRLVAERHDAANLEEETQAQAVREVEE